MSNPRYSEEFKNRSRQQVGRSSHSVPSRPLRLGCRHTACINGSSATISPPPATARMDDLQAENRRIEARAQTRNQKSANILKNCLPGAPAALRLEKHFPAPTSPARLSSAGTGSFSFFGRLKSPSKTMIAGEACDPLLVRAFGDPRLECESDRVPPSSTSCWRNSHEELNLVRKRFTAVINDHAAGNRY